ncbi:tyrosine-type recombinase/integrase [Parasedimentitalea psychrophila]|uniref:Tyrosine-type recombinase/integrase n=2 Tax=Parasedimentitalea psychrophila TaxID=2997337 RepID=A0A9Y2KZ66_9RHOB|nr:site-specific integrase [Parasedimentitalea psychrophila]WIY24567.1 tyrosine-type recombinase/integrase [Parasedimentitalea psychrophila]
MAKLTKRVVDALQSEAKDYFVWDSQIAGFGLRVMPSGAKTYQAQYRKGGRTRRVSIGRHGKITVDEARKLAKEVMGQVAKGENPAEEISLHRKAPTVAALCERFFEEHAKQRCKPSTQGEYRRAIDLFIIPAIGSFKTVDVERRDIAELHQKFRDKPYQANRTLGVLSKMFNLAEIWGLRPDGSNPCRHVPKYREIKRERYLSQQELRRLGQVLGEADQDGSETPYVIAAFRLLILTGCRLGEIQTLQWQFITDSGMELPDTKTGARLIPLPQAARAVLSTLPQLADNPYVIAGKLPGQYATDLQHPWRRIREPAGIPDVRIHDLRHTYSSNAVSSGMPIQMVGRLLGHTQIQTTMRYAHLANDPVNRAAEENAERLNALVGTPTTERVLRVVR